MEIFVTGVLLEEEEELAMLSLRTERKNGIIRFFADDRSGGEGWVGRMTEVCLYYRGEQRGSWILDLGFWILDVATILVLGVLPAGKSMRCIHSGL